ncbi:helix-turn-helix transcriptional regulator [Dictyobacter aurantiacus]|uniref:Transcriptional regulator n=1 Tax=Dictyobacter aurantiacus TaxID=1936993 RepID=A0A401ZSD2_9CHLR|nr:YafY family protein [Dictyobacter aurantiacus]GCE09787.1 transcriptional regulator [Dictyobacter aurantiacus]
MQRFDRILGILLFLRGNAGVTVADLARHFSVSRRTIHRDLETLSTLGVPLYAERGRAGGFRLLEGYFLPPLMFTQEEAVALLVCLTLQKSLRTSVFPQEMLLAEKKLLMALPDRLRAMLEKGERLLGFERFPHDIFHIEPEQQSAHLPSEIEQRQQEAQQSAIMSIFFQAILDGCQVQLHYFSPYRNRQSEIQLVPLGLFWDRNYWYLVGQPVDNPQADPRLWRVDRVQALHALKLIPVPTDMDAFDVRTLLNRQWLGPAMEKWRRSTPVTIRLMAEQARRLQQDWYYAHAEFAPDEKSDHVLMTLGECDSDIVFSLVRWLGPGAELLAPQEWRSRLRAELQQMLDSYDDT